MKFVSLTKWALVLCAALALVALAGQAKADTVYAGVDDNVGPTSTPRPVSQAAANIFDAAAGGLGALHVINFEALPFSNATVQNLGSGVTATFTHTDPALSRITDTASSGDAVTGTLGFGILPSSGSKFLQFAPDSTNFSSASLTLAFSTPIQAFGAYLTGTERNIDGTLTLNYNNGSSQIVPIAKGLGGSVVFTGVTSPGAFINSVVINEAGPFVTRDIWGLDDLRYVNNGVAVVPLPKSATAGLGLISALAIFRLVRTKKRDEVTDAI